MVKHNNLLPNRHFHKDWQNRVRCNLDQPARQVRRRNNRKAKAALVAPRPVSGLLRPAVHCPTQRYNIKVRAGRGFTKEELKEAGINAKQARTIGIAVDHRRRNKSLESLQLNAQRLQEYKTKLIVFPRKAGKTKKGDSTPEECKAASQLTGALMPIKGAAPQVTTMAITAEMKNHNVIRQFKQLKATQYLEGKRRWKKDDEDEEAEAK